MSPAHRGPEGSVTGGYCQALRQKVFAPEHSIRWWTLDTSSKEYVFLPAPAAHCERLNVYGDSGVDVPRPTRQCQVGLPTAALSGPSIADPVPHCIVHVRPVNRH